jgi:hypothetical protein
MLVITANWGFTDGSLWQPSPSRHAAWLAAVHRAALRGGFGRDGTYRPIEALDIVFAGDTLDCLGSRHWTGDARPWHGGAAAHAARNAVLAAAARHGRRLFATLGRWVRTGLPVPTADRRGRPRTILCHRAAVRVTLLAGDRDRWIEQAAPAARRHGYAIGRVWASTDLLVHHGAEFDPLWTTGEAEGDHPAAPGDRQPLLGESLAVDLVARFAATISDRLPTRPVLRTLLSVMGASRGLELPVVLAGWLDAVTGDRSLPAADGDTIVAVWKRAVAAWHREAIRCPPVSGLEASPVDALAEWFAEGPTATPRSTAAIASLQPRLGPAAVRNAARDQRPAAPFTTVLGHLAPPVVAGPAAARFVCLGGPANRTLIRGRGPAPGWEPFDTDAPEAMVIGLGSATVGGGGDTVVDAICDTTSDPVGHAA